MKSLAVALLFLCGARDDVATESEGRPVTSTRGVVVLASERRLVVREERTGRLASFRVDEDTERPAPLLLGAFVEVESTAASDGEARDAMSVVSAPAPRVSVRRRARRSEGGR